MKYKLFVSANQKELKDERFAIKEVITSNSTLRGFFDVFLFKIFDGTVLNIDVIEEITRRLIERKKRQKRKGVQSLLLTKHASITPFCLFLLRFNLSYGGTTVTVNVQ